MTQPTATQAGYQKNILDYGADPTGQTDSSAAFQAAANAESGAIIIPDTGIFKIDKTVSLRGGNASRKGMFSEQVDHFGSYGNRGSIFPGDNLDGPMFDGAHVVQGVNFSARGRSGKTCLELDSYVNRIENCYFNGFEVAISCYGGVDLSVINNLFTYCTTAFRSTQGVATASRFERNQCQSCTHCFVYENELWSTIFSGNIFERIGGDAIAARTLYDCAFRENWWENYTGSDNDPQPVRSTQSQQIQRCVSSGNHVQGGWFDMFTTDGDDRNGGGMGGVSLDGNAARVRDSTGALVKITPVGIESHRAAWKPNEPFVIQTGFAKGSGLTQNLTFRMPGRGGRVIFDSTRDSLGEGLFKGYFGFVKSLDDNGEPRYDQLRLNTDTTDAPVPGLRGDSQLASGTALIGIPQYFYCREGNYGRGLAAFSSVTRPQEGQVAFKTPYRIDNPIIQITVEDAGIVLDGITYDRTNTSATTRWSTGFTVHFVDRETGEPRTPQGFFGTLLTTPDKTRT